MSGTGVNALALYDPQLYAQQQSLARKQALANALLTSQTESGAYGGLANAGKQILGAFLARSSDHDVAHMYNGAFGSGGQTAATTAPTGSQTDGPPPSPPLAPVDDQAAPATSPQISNTAGARVASAPSASPQALADALTGKPPSSVSVSALPPIDNSIGLGMPGTQSATQAQMPPPQLIGQAQGVPAPSQSPQQNQPPPAAPEAGKPADYAGLAPQMQHLYDQIPHVRGLTARDSVSMFLTAPSDYNKALTAQAAPTDAMKNAAAVYGYDSPQYRQNLSDNLAKGSAINTTRGETRISDGHGGYNIIYAPPPPPAGYHYEGGQDGQPQLVQTTGGIQAVQASAQAQQTGKAGGTPDIGYEQQQMPDGSYAWMPKATNQAAMLGGNSPQPQNPMQPTAPQGQAQGPQPTLRMQNPAATFQGIIGAPVMISSADRTPSHNAAVGGVPDSAHLSPGEAYDIVPQGMSTQQAAQRLSQSGVPFDQIIDEGSHVHVSFAAANRRQTLGGGQQTAAAGGTPGVLPELPPGVAAGATSYQNNMSNSAGGEWKQTHDMAADVPTRVNVLQSILNLSQSGAPTGSTEWLNEARQAAASLSQAMGRPVDASNPAALMTEIQKYMGQYSNRMAQGQGGTGTDKQLEAVQEANPNETMFPATLRRVVPWIMANERGIAAKANFLDAQPGAMNDPHAQIAAQNAWRNIYSPRVAQFEMMNPQQQAGYLKDPKAFSSAADRNSFIQSALKLHPYFQGQP